MTKFQFFIIIFLFLSNCQTVSKKIDEKSSQEEKELTKWLNKTETELKITYGRPDRIEFLNGNNRYYIYYTKKFKIKCERKFEISSKDKVIGFISKNCF